MPPHPRVPSLMPGEVPNPLERLKVGDTVLFYTEDECHPIVVRSNNWPSTVSNPTEALLRDQGIRIRDFAVEAAGEARAAGEQQRKRHVELRAQGVSVRDFGAEVAEEMTAMARADALRTQMQLRENGVSVRDFAKDPSGRDPPARRPVFNVVRK